MAKDLTVKAVKAAKPTEKRYETSDGHTRGLHLVVFPSGAKSWVLRYRYVSKPKKVTIGPVLEDRPLPVPTVPLGTPHTLAEARAAAQALKLVIAGGNDPAAKAPSAVGALTVRGAAELFMVARRAQEKNRTAGEVQRQFDATILPAIGDRPIAQLTGAEARAVVKKLETAGSLIMANRVHATLARFCRWCAEKDQQFVPASPYAGYDKPAPEPSRDRVLSWAEVAALWEATGDTGQPFGPLIRLLLLTGQRRSEVTEITDGEIDRGQAIWTIPRDRAKNGKAHTVPLTAAALTQFDAIDRIGKAGLIFTTNGETPFAGHNKAKAKLDAALQFNAPWRLHDIRRTVATGMAELGEPIHVVEAVLNHKSGTVSGIAAVYNVHAYAQEKRHAMEAWARFLTDIIANEHTRLAYGAMNNRRTFRNAIHSTDKVWRRYLATMMGSNKKVAA